MASRSPLSPSPSPATGRPGRASSRLGGALLLTAGLLLAGCQDRSSAEMQRIEQLELKIQQLEQRLNAPGTLQPDPADAAGKPPSGPVKSLTFRTGTDDDRLRIYWGDGTRTDLPCTREQATYVCG